MSSSEMQYLEKNTLSARDFTLAANNRCAGHPDGNSKGLEGTLSLVVVIVTSDNVDVHGDTRLECLACYQLAVSVGFSLVPSTNLAHGNEDVLGSVVVVNVEVTTASELQTPARVLRKGVDHMVQEANASVDVDCLRL